MGRVAVITDVHANLPALEAVLARIDELGVERVLCGGDLVGYGPRPDEVCAAVRDGEIPTVYGNYDHAIARDQTDCGCAYRDPHEQQLGERSVAWTLEHTAEASKRFMRELPFDLSFELGERRVRLVHGSPRKVNEYLFADKPARTFERIAADVDEDVLAFGHTHRPWIADHGGVRFVNCGAVGKPKDGDPRAAFAVLEARDGELDARIERVDYDIEAAAGEIEAADGLPDAYAQMLRTAS